MLRLVNKPLRSFSHQFHSCAIRNKASIFKMPAMSPTMERGGIQSWKLKEGDSFASGDILVEIETDKSTIDVDAQDDGVLVKILKNDGANEIDVGVPIAILAEPGDDLATLELPSIEDSSSSSAKASTPAPSAPEPKKEAPPQPKESSSNTTSSSSTTFAPKDANPNQTFFPSVQSLLKENDISREDALSKIKATGPQGRLVKGDVLAYLGKISTESVNKIATFIEKNTHLDLSNIEKLKIQPKASESESSSSSDSKDKAASSTKSKKPSKPEPKIITKTFKLDDLYEFQSKAVEKGIKPFEINDYLKEASSRSEVFAYKQQDVKSDYYDPIFEDLLTPSSSVERFQIKLTYPKQEQYSNKALDVVDFFNAKDDLFNDLTSNSSDEFTVSLTINEKIIDSEQKAKLYLSKLESYLHGLN